MSGARRILLAAGPDGLAITIPDSVQVPAISRPVLPGAALGVEDQQRLVKTAAEAPLAGAPLRGLAQGHRRAVVLVGDLSLPAPYDIAVPPVLAALLEAEIRPTRIALLACPGASGPVLGCAAIHRYGEEVVGEYELRSWQGGSDGAQADPLYAAADLRVAVGPLLPWGTTLRNMQVDFAVALALGRKLRVDMVSALAGPRPEVRSPAPEAGANAAVFITSGGGADWETTLEEALLSLHVLTPAVEWGRGTVVLAFSGSAGLGSSRFTRDLWALLGQADKVLAGGGALTAAEEQRGWFDPAATLARALSAYGHLVLLSPDLARHQEGDELAERLAGLPAAAQRFHFCGREEELWESLARWHGAGYRLAVEPLGWRGQCPENVLPVGSVSR